MNRMPVSAAAIPLIRPWLGGNEQTYLAEVLQRGQLAGGGPFGARCSERLAALTGARAVLLTGSATHAMELACLVSDLQPGDEVIMPSFTFASTANAVALRGAVPVFVDIREDTLNLDERLVEAAITSRTRMLLPVHYAGVACDMAALCKTAARHGLVVLEDAAHAIGAAWRGRPLGSIGNFGAFSFHHTKNLAVGEAGALLLNDPQYLDRAEIAWEKGTTRRKFARGEIDKYTWVDLGSSWLVGELVAAVLLAQLEALDTVTRLRCEAWQRYHDGFAPLERSGRVRRPVVPADCAHNGHIYFLLCRDPAERERLIADLAAQRITAAFHYIPLHSSPAGLRFGRTSGGMQVTDQLSARLVRLPLYAGITEAECARVIAAVEDSLG